MASAPSSESAPLPAAAAAAAAPGTATDGPKRQPWRVVAHKRVAGSWKERLPLDKLELEQTQSFGPSRAFLLGVGMLLGLVISYSSLVDAGPGGDAQDMPGPPSAEAEQAPMPAADFAHLLGQDITDPMGGSFDAGRPPAAAPKKSKKKIPKPSASKHLIFRQKAKVSVWNKKSVLGSDGGNVCRMREAAFSPSIAFCIRTYPELVSDAIQKHGLWGECKVMARILEAEYVNSMYSKVDRKEFDSTDGGLFVDIGANVGACSAYMAAKLKNKVVAFEPLPANLYYLTNTFLKNKGIKDMLRLYPVGLGAQESTQDIFVDPQNAGHAVVGVPSHTKSHAEPAKAGQVKVYRLDDILRPPYPVVKLMKIDVEGSEAAVLFGAKQLLTSGAVLSMMIEVGPFLKSHGSSRLTLMNTVISYGFCFVTDRGELENPTFLKDIACSGRKDLEMSNLIAIRRSGCKQVPACKR
mmetsp:Transcript_47895/g.113823  ORF Transcript_47895/g.113823 Transcript_47895/m.113823 type:complete len:466 (-) Transcript_47895:161-1558(-)